MALAMPSRHTYPVAGRCQLADQVAADETAAAEDANTVSLHAFHILKLILARPGLSRCAASRSSTVQRSRARHAIGVAAPPVINPGRVRRDGSSVTLPVTADDARWPAMAHGLFTPPAVFLVDMRRGPLRHASYT